ncbi:MAG: NAD-dependent epimerase/dehydratase family protein [Tardiphaga sp.]
MRLFVFGLGYSASHFIAGHGARFSAIAGTARTPQPGAAVETLAFGPDHVDPAIAAHLARADVLLVSVPPDADGDPVLRAFGPQIAASGIRRVVYLSTVGVYGDHGGGWIDETAELAGSGRRRHRIDAEAAWLAGGATSLRLAGIYGPGRNALVNLRAGRAHRIVKPGQVFNRIHVDDIAAAIARAIDHAGTGAWNVCDDEPAPPQDVVTFAASLMGVTPPPEQDFATAQMSAMARSFYASNNRICNARMKSELGVVPLFPTYREGLTSLAKSDAPTSSPDEAAS